MKFTIYDAQNGQVLYGGMADDPAALLQPGQDLLEDEQHSSGYVEDGKHFELPEQPSIHHIFDYASKQWVDPRTPDTQWPVMRAKRNQLLAASDWTQLPDVPLATKEAWAIYRQALRDITLQQDPFNIVWPVPPGS